jgi:hypothetical protein
MKRETKEVFLCAIKKAQEDFDAAVEEAATKFRLEVLIPLCKKYKLEFVSGMGRTVFYADNWEKYSTEDARCPESFEYEWELKDTKLEGKLTHALDLLNKEVSGNDVFGYYVSDVRKADYE